MKATMKSLGFSKIFSKTPKHHMGEYDDAKARLLEPHDQARSPQRCEHGSTYSRAVILVLHLGFTLAWVSTAVCLYLRPSSSRSNWRSAGCGIREAEFSPVAPAIEYEEVLFDLSGFGTREKPVTIYEGPPNVENNLRWHELIDVGIIALDSDLQKAFGQPTEPSSATDNTPLIQLDVFHQLHCLNSVRRIVYGTSTFTKGVNAEMHVDHCLDYLRQAIMCTSDVTPIPHIPRPNYAQRHKGAPWMPNFATRHTCRNFWKIHEWAAKHNTSGWTLEGYPDQGVELAE